MTMPSALTSAAASNYDGQPRLDGAREVTAHVPGGYTAAVVGVFQVGRALSCGTRNWPVPLTSGEVIAVPGISAAVEALASLLGGISRSVEGGGAVGGRRWPVRGG